MAIRSIVKTKSTEHYEFWNLSICTHTGRRIQNARAQNQKRVWEDRGAGYFFGTAATEACCSCLCNQVVASYPLSFLKVKVKAVCGSYSTDALRHIVLLPE